MIRKACLLVLFALYLTSSFGQNQQLLYGFDQLPQTLMLNPGAEVAYSKHIGIPFLSNVYFQAGATNRKITYDNIYAGTNGNSEVLRNIYAQNLNSGDLFVLNQKLEILNAGLRLKNPDYYLSFGMYEEMDGFANYPKELVELYYEGDLDEDDNAQQSVKNFNDINVIGELVGVLHLGISKKINNDLNIGARFKIISGSLNLQSKNNKGHYYLGSMTPPYSHQFNDLNMGLHTSGLINAKGNNILNRSDIIKNTFFMSGNYGLGIDLGMTYKVTESLTVAASLLDLDYIKYSNKVTSYEVKDDFEIVDNDLYDPPVDGTSDYWDDILDIPYDNGDLLIDTLQVAYNSFRSPKLHASVKYRINVTSSEKYNSVFRNSRYVTPTNTSSISAIGIQTYTAFRPNDLVWAITAFYSREITKNFNTKITYTYDQFSAKNFGIGFSTHIRKFNFYATADNLLALPKLKDSNYQTFQFGLNFIFY